MDDILLNISYKDIPTRCTRMSYPSPFNHKHNNTSGKSDWSRIAKLIPNITNLTEATANKSLQYKMYPAMFPIKSRQDISHQEKIQHLTSFLTYGPIVAIINNTDFVGYKGGILDPPKEPNIYPTRQYVLIVGYYRGSPDPSASPEGIWKILNTWGKNWGDQGYGYLSKKWIDNPDLLGPFYVFRPGFVSSDIAN